MKVVHCFRSPVGGLFRHVVDLVRYQANSGMQTGIICDSTTGRDQAEKVLTELATICELGVYRIPIGRLPSPADLRSLKKAEIICEKIQPDVVHGHGAKGGAFSRLLSGKIAARSVYTPHGGALHYNPMSPAGAIFFTMERILGKKTDAVIFESQFSATSYEQKIGQIPGENRVIHNGLSEQELAAGEHIAGDFDFLFLGEFRALKGIDVLFAAAAIINQDRPIRVLVAGGGRGKPEKLIAEVKSLGLENSIEISAPIYPAQEAFRRAKCIVVPSRAESFPYIVLEAAAAGIPIIATSVGGIGEIFGPYSDRLIAPDDPELLATAMLAVLNDPQKAASDAAQLRERVRELFSIPVMGTEISRLYRDICAADQSSQV